MRNMITIDNMSLTECGWARVLGVTRAAIGFRKKKFGETPLEAILHFKDKDKRINPCPFCHYRITDTTRKDTLYWLECQCGYRSKSFFDPMEAIYTHNKITKKIR